MTRSRTYKVGDHVYIFLTWDAFDMETPITPENLMFLAEGTVKKLDWERYFVHIDHILFTINKKMLFQENQVSQFAHIWIDRGEEAYNVWNNPSLRLKNESPKSESP